MEKENNLSFLLNFMKALILLTIIVFIIISVVTYLKKQNEPIISGGRIWDTVSLEIDDWSLNYEVEFSIDGDKLKNFTYSEDNIYYVDIYYFDYNIDDLMISIYENNNLIKEFKFIEVCPKKSGKDNDYHLIYRSKTGEILDKEKIEEDNTIEIESRNIELPENFIWIFTGSLMLITEIIIYIILKRKQIKYKNNVNS